MVMGDDSCSRGRGFESLHHILDRHFLTLICCNNCIVCLKITKINKKEAGDGPFKKIMQPNCRRNFTPVLLRQN